MNKNNKIIPLKCVSLGSPGVGKTNIISRYVKDEFTSYSQPTIGAAFNSKLISNGDKTIKLELWDTAGQERFDSIVPMYYRDANVVLIVYDITMESTLEKAKYWLNKLRKESTNNKTYILIGNKLDMHHNREVSQITAKVYADDNDLIYFECSAKNGTNINNIFEKVIEYGNINIQKDSDQPLIIDATEENNTQNNYFSSCYKSVTNLFIKKTQI
jgi:Ras-related protein Rab-5C